MHAAGEQRSWQVSARPFKTAALALALLAAIAAIAEIVARTDAVTRWLPPPSYSTRIRFFDQQMARLGAQVRAHGPVDCVFLGSSGALHAFDPQVFTQTYAEKTGRRLHCFNFGLPGASVADARAIAPILRHDYGVRLFVFGFTRRDVSTGALALRLEDNPWIKRRTAGFNFDGFLTDTSVAFRYFAAFRRWMDATREEPFATFRIREDGYFPSGWVLQRSAVVTGWELGMARQSVGIYDPRSFSRLMALADTGAEIVLVEIPRSEAMTSSVSIPEEARIDTPAYKEFLARLAAKAESSGIVLIERPPLEMIPIEGWSDYVHLNAHGAELFSRWAATRMAEASAAKRAVEAHPIAGAARTEKHRGG